MLIEFARGIRAVCGLLTAISLVAIVVLLGGAVFGASGDDIEGLFGGSGLWAGVLSWGAVLIVSSVIGTRAHARVVLDELKVYECRRCGRESDTEDEAMSHAASAHGAMSFPEMRATWERRISPSRFARDL